MHSCSGSSLSLLAVRCQSRRNASPEPRRKPHCSSKRTKVCSSPSSELHIHAATASRVVDRAATARLVVQVEAVGALAQLAAMERRCTKCRSSGIVPRSPGIELQRRSLRTGHPRSHYRTNLALKAL